MKITLFIPDSNCIKKIKFDLIDLDININECHTSVMTSSNKTHRLSHDLVTD